MSTAPPTAGRVTAPNHPPVTRAEYQGHPPTGRWDDVTRAGILQPRDRVAASRSLAVVALTAAVVIVSYEVFGVLAGGYGRSAATLATASGVASGLFAIAAVASWLPDRMPSWSWVASPVVGVGVAMWVGFGSGVGSLLALVGLVYPVLFAAAHLHPVLAWAVTLVALGADVVLAVFLEPPVGLPVAAVVAAALVLVTTVLQMLAAHQERLTTRLSEIAAIDQLTGLASRRRLEEVAAEVLTTPCLPGDFSLGPALAIIDLDHFKTLNDTYGHPVGDAALVHVAALLRTTCPSRATVARLGGDELAVLLPCAPPDELAQVLARFHDAVRTSPMNHLGRVLALGVSAGGTHVPATRQPDLLSLYARADEALYQAKLDGRGCVRIV